MEKPKLFYAVHYAGFTKQQYNSIREATIEKNHKMLKMSSCVALVLMIILFVISFLPFGLQHNRTLYLGFAVCTIPVLVASRLIDETHKDLILPLCYLMLSLGYAYAINIGVFLQPHIPATTFCALAVCLPLLIVDKPYKILLLQLLWTVVFSLLCIFIKDKNIISIDITNASMFLILGTAINYSVLKIMISDLLNVEHIKRERDTDDLTKLLTKGAAIRAVNEYIQEGGKDASILVIDIDNFKKINDTMGHAYGDVVLRLMGECIRKVFKNPYDILSRFGGDEFMLFLPGLTEPAALRKMVSIFVGEMSQLLTSPETATPITGSIGIAFYPADADNYAALFAKADSALYKSKGKGKNCYTFYVDSDVNHIIE